MITQDSVFEIINAVPQYNFEEDNKVDTVRELNVSNVVPRNKLRKIQDNTLKLLSNYISNTFGPMASNTQIITGNTSETIVSDYSKDGLRVLKQIKFSQPLEMAIQSEVVDIAQYVEKKVGDGTTSSVVLSSYIFSGLMTIEEKYSIPPRKLVSIFKQTVDQLQKSIKKNSRPMTLDDVYEIAMISTNGNVEVSKQIESLYKKYGFDVSIDVGTSDDENSKVKIYDGLTINEGYSDIAYINNTISGTADIHNPRIYAFQDPIDTPEMINFMEKIIVENILNHAEDQEYVPTVIISPTITRDASGLMNKLVSILYEYDNSNIKSQKPPILILTNIHGTDEEIYNDIANLCHCKMIRKYIDPKIQKEDQDKGEAPTLDTITEWYGTAELVSSDNNKTKFINPKAMVTEGDKTYDRLVNFLKAEIKKAKLDSEDHLTVGRLKKRLRCLEANMIEYLVGGISIADRNSAKDLVEDAVKNIASASVKGVGRAANFEGLLASYKLARSYYTDPKYKDTQNTIDIATKDIAYIIFDAYYQTSKQLYSTVIGNNSAYAVIGSLQREKPYNIMDLFNQYTDYTKFESTKQIDINVNETEPVLCSINTDIEILGAISKIITLMVSSNQCLLQAPALNKY